MVSERAFWEPRTLPPKLTPICSDFWILLLHHHR